jgi:DNA end-binding protein Ku
MPLPIWKGHVSFGLVSVPVSLFSAERRGDVHFHLIDSRDVARVRYQRINSETGEEVPWDKIVKGYEYADGNYVLLSEKELEAASGELSHSIDIQQFVDVEQIRPMYFDKPYYLAPSKLGEKGYVLLREAMTQTGKVGIALVAIRTRQYLSALVPEGNLLMLELLRFQQELRDPSELDIPGDDLRDYDISTKEVQLARQLVDGMTSAWDPDQFQDKTRESLLELIERKVKQGKTEAIEEPEEAAAAEDQGKTINFIQALKKSVAQSGGKPSSRRKAGLAGRRGRRKKKAG